MSATLPQSINLSLLLEQFDMNILLLGGIAALACLAVLMLFASVFLRRVVPTNEVHIVQTKKHTISYGKGETAGNTYWKWPGFMLCYQK
jgi:flotillin